jgi:hypothetical protein
LDGTSGNDAKVIDSGPQKLRILLAEPLTAPGSDGPAAVEPEN